MKNSIRILQAFFAVPWLVFGAQHFMFADFVASLVPAFFPAHHFWVYFTGAAMIAAGLSLIINIKARLAAALLGAMLLGFILLVHIPRLASGDLSAMALTRFFQDAAIAASALILAGVLPNRSDGGESDLLDRVARTSRYVLAILLIIFGISQFLNLDFLTAKVAPFAPARIALVYLTGTAMIVAGVCVLTNRLARIAALALGGLMLFLNLLLYTFLLAKTPSVPLIWTAAMLDLAITCGVFVLAVTAPTRPVNTPN